MNQPSQLAPFAGPFPESQPSPYGGPPVFSANAMMAPPYAYGAARPASPHGTAPRRRRTGLIIGCAVAVVSTVVIAGLVSWLMLRPNPDEVGIRSAMADFSSAVAAGDLDGASRQLCAAEVEWLKGAHVPSSAPHAASTNYGDDAHLTDIKIRGDVAAAAFIPSAGSHQDSYFRKEGGAWKVCQTAQKDFAAAMK
ncbi:MAG: hypothetical protein QOE30_3858 [Mycobacterium sp.]|uniref:Rv0361 family membrane protein n=1 Tax=Mycobacterium sp. TaxID=1785 RepID=UPI0028B9FCD9|nr:hypothetical protein [Mycobacterium sp.]MDT5118119.1 hypothetical protein [Mycobacterium sp.]